MGCGRGWCARQTRAFSVNQARVYRHRHATAFDLKKHWSHYRPQELTPPRQKPGFSHQFHQAESDIPTNLTQPNEIRIPLALHQTLCMQQRRGAHTRETGAGRRVSGGGGSREDQKGVSRVACLQRLSFKGL